MELNVFVACDSYKGSLTSVEANECIKEGVMTVFKSANVECYPIADGGEGTVDAYTYNCCFHKTKRYVKKLSVTFTKISCF